MSAATAPAALGTMRALVKEASGRGGLVLKDVERRALARGEVRIEVAAAGICGTDLHILEGRWPIAPPVVMGHEVAGVVRETADDVDLAWLGARVASETFFSTCGRCDLCVSGFKNLCAQRRSIGSHVHGAFAPEVIVPAGNLHRLPDWLDLVDAALMEPLACAVNCLCDPGVVQAGDRVLVSGPGTMGLLAAQIAAACGGEVEVVGTARDAARLAVARELGFRTRVVGEDPPAADDSVDVAIEAAGSAAAASAGLRALRRRGRYVQVGLIGAPSELPFDEVCIKELRISSGLAAPPRAWRRALQLVTERRVALGPLVSAVAPLDEWERLVAQARAGDGVKLVFVPGGRS